MSEDASPWQPPRPWLTYGEGVRRRATHRREALLAFHAALDGGASKTEATEAARAKYTELAGVPVTARNVRNWLRTIAERGGRDAPLVAHCDGKECVHAARRLRVPEEFVAALKRKCLEPGVGVFSAAVRAFEMAWQAGAVVPGLGSASRLGEPFPYKETQLRRFAPSKAARVQGARGKFAVKAGGLIPAPPISTANLRLRQEVIMDDKRLDMVAVDDQTGRHVSLVMYLAMDRATRQILGYILREDGAIRQTDVEALTAFVLRVCGFAGKSAGYATTLKFERGTVAISPEREALLTGMFPGELLISRTSMIGGRNAPGDFAQSASGNFFGKGALESFMRTLDCYTRHLVGQRGNHFGNTALMLGDLLTAPSRIASPNYKARGSMIEESVIAATNAQAVHWLETGETAGALESCKATGIRPPLLFVSEVNLALQGVLAYYNALRGHRREGFANLPAVNARGGLDWIAESSNDKAERLARELASEGRSLTTISDADAAVLLHKVKRATVTANGARVRIGGRERLYWCAHSRAIAAAQHSSAGKKVFLALYNPEDPRELYILDNAPGRLPATAEELPPEVAPVFLESLPLYEAPDANDDAALAERARQVQANAGRIGREYLRNVLPFVEDQTQRRERNLELSEPIRAAVSALRGPGTRRELPATQLGTELSRARQLQAANDRHGAGHAADGETEAEDFDER